jgi:V/A-type H+-transporting ATPase subunit E
MKPEDENIEALSRAILRDAQEEALQIQAEAEAKAETIRQRAREQAEAERKTILERARQDAERLGSQAVATAQLKARTLQLEHREKLLDKVFESASQKLLSVQKRADFEQVTVRLLREALTQLKVDQAEVRADEATVKLLQVKTLEKVAKEMNTRLTIGKALEEGTGIVVEASDGRVKYDNTLETRLERLQSALRSSVYHVLMGEKL